MIRRHHEAADTNGADPNGADPNGADSDGADSNGAGTNGADSKVIIAFITPCVQTWDDLGQLYIRGKVRCNGSTS